MNIVAPTVALLTLLSYNLVGAESRVTVQPCTAPLSASALKEKTAKRRPTVSALNPDLGVIAAENIFHCMNSKQYSMVVALATSEFLQREFGILKPENASAVLQGVPPFVLHFLSNPQTHTDGSVGIDLIYGRETGAHMLVHERWFFVQKDARWLLARLEPLDVLPAGPRVTVGVVMSHNSVTLTQSHFTAGESLVFDIRNLGENPRELAVFKLPEGIKLDQGEPVSVIAEGQFVGVASAQPGQSAAPLVLIGLKPGRYTVVSSVAVYGGGVKTQPPSVVAFTVQ